MDRMPVRLDRHLGKEALDFAPQIGGCLFHRFRRGEHGLRRLLGFGGGASHFAQHHDDQLGAVGGACHVLRNLAGRGALLLHRRGNGGCIVIDLSHAVCDPADRFHGLTGRVLHFQDLAGNILGRLGGLHGQRLHFGSNYRKATACFTGARRLNGGVERQQISLPGDVATSRISFRD